jgi:hypothetical protein
LQANRIFGEINSAAARAKGEGSQHVNFAILDIDVHLLEVEGGKRMMCLSGEDGFCPAEII